MEGLLDVSFRVSFRGRYLGRFHLLILRPVRNRVSGASPALWNGLAREVKLFAKDGLSA
jgi:hypothetical protein